MIVDFVNKTLTWLLINVIIVDTLKLRNAFRLMVDEIYSLHEQNNSKETIEITRIQNEMKYVLIDTN